jgi:ATP-dependent Clp protease protease subunit
MTLRSLPTAPSMSRHPQVRSDISEGALSRWEPNIRQAADSSNPTISILDVIGQDWMGNGITAARVSGALRAIGKQDVTVEINSPGGDFFEGLAIYNALREHPMNVTVKVLGLAASAAAVIAMAGDTVMVPRAGFLMIHNVWVMAMGDQNDLREIADSLQPFDAVAADIFAARSNLPPSDIVNMLNVETWMSGSEAVNKGFADSLLPSDQLASAPRNELSAGPSGAIRRMDSALAKGERLPRSERRKLINELTGTPCAAGKDDMPGAVENAVADDGSAGLRFALARFKLATA